MKNLFAFFKEHIIELLILFMALIILTATIFSAVVILNPDRFSGFPLVRETVLALSTAAMVFATLILALGTFVIIRHNRKREDHLRRERWVNEIIDWAEYIQSTPSNDNPSLYPPTWADIFAFRLNKLEISLNKSKQIKYIAEVLDKDLEYAVENTCSKIEYCINASGGVLTSRAKAPHTNSALIKFLDLMHDAQKSANEVIRLASNVKISLLL